MIASIYKMTEIAKKPLKTKLIHSTASPIKLIYTHNIHTHQNTFAPDIMDHFGYIFTDTEYNVTPTNDPQLEANVATQKRRNKNKTACTERSMFHWHAPLL